LQVTRDVQLDNNNGYNYDWYSAAALTYILLDVHPDGRPMKPHIQSSGNVRQAVHYYTEVGGFLWML